jgi:protein ImuA
MFSSVLSIPDPPGLNPTRVSLRGLDPAVPHPADANLRRLDRTAAVLHDLRERIGRIEHVHDQGGATKSIPIGIPAIDQALPAGGLRLGALHETVSAGPDTEHAAAATLFSAGILSRLDGPVLWVLRQPDLFAPGLAAAGLRPDRIIFAEAGKAVLPVMEEGLRHPALAAVVAELTGRLSLVASRRLQLAAEQSGILAILIRRSRGFDDPLLQQPTAASTRWRIAALPSPPALPHAPDTPGLGRARWRLELTRCRGGKPGSWIVEAGDATGCLDLVPDISDRSDQAAERRSA